MRTPPSILVFVFTPCALLCGCEKDIIDPGRQDTGVVPDSGLGGPLSLQPGMTFTYRATLTYRSDAVAEETSQYELTVRIATVDDQGPQGNSSLTFTSTGAHGMDDDWQPTSDFDLWIARLGPSLSGDQISAGAIEDPLIDPPTIPPFPMPPKQLPRAGTFFIDVRAIDRIGNAFTEAHQSQQPQVIPPDTESVWVFSYEGADPTNIYYLANKKRTIRAEYDPKGWLTRLEEYAGDSSTPPASYAVMMLVSGP